MVSSPEVWDPSSASLPVVDASVRVIRIVDPDTLASLKRSKDPNSLFLGIQNRSRVKHVILMTHTLFDRSPSFVDREMRSRVDIGLTS